MNINVQEIDQKQEIKLNYDKLMIICREIIKNYQNKRRDCKEITKKCSGERSRREITERDRREIITR